MDKNVQLQGSESNHNSDESAAATEDHPLPPKPEELLSFYTELGDLYKYCTDNSLSAGLSNCSLDNSGDGSSESGPSSTQNKEGDVTEALKKALEKLSLGLSNDKTGNFRGALDHYKDGLQHLLFVKKYTKMPEPFCTTLTQKCKEFLTRAEEVKEKLKVTDPGKEVESLNACQLPDFVNVQSTAVLFKDVVGLENAKDVLKQYVILPVKYPQLFSGSRAPQKGILFYGAPGVGKTMLARALAGELGEEALVLRVSIYDYLSKYLGDGDRKLRETFEYAGQHTPSILIFDDFEGLFPQDEGSGSARRLKTEWLCQFHGLPRHTNVLALTQSPWLIDAPVRRRLCQRVCLPLPDGQTRAQIFKHFLTPPQLTSDLCPQLTEEDLAELADKAEGYTGSDICGVTRDAMMAPIRELQTAKFFRKVKIEGGQTSDMSDKTEEKFVPCGEGDEGAEERNFLDISEGELYVRPLSKEDVLKSIGLSEPSVSGEIIAQLDQFTQDFVL